MEIEAQKQAILQLIKVQTLGVISTVSAQGLPESALIGVTETVELDIIFGTSKLSRKYSNLANHPYVAFCISDISNKATVQYEGIARELSGQEKTEALDLHIKKNPFAAKFVQDPNEVWFKVKPSWIRFTDYGSHPGNIFEIKF